MLRHHVSDAARWAGRNAAKDAIRNDVWSTLKASGSGVGDPFSRIPNFIGADAAAQRLSELPFWKRARVVKSNPDPPQMHVRLQALRERKIVYMPVPELVAEYPFVELSPSRLLAEGCSLEVAASADGALATGRRVEFDQMQPFDLVVVGCVAVTRSGARIGKGGGFADLELGIFREVGLVNSTTPIVTTVHPDQIVPDERAVMTEHDSALHWIATPDEVIETEPRYGQPKGVYWDQVEPDQFETIPFLRKLRERLQPPESING